MLSTPVGGLWGNRFVRFAVSCFLIWHILAMVVAPAPEGYLKRSALSFLDPYLNLLFLQNDWGFFSPVGLSQQFRFVIADQSGKEHVFTPSQGVKWYDASALWQKDRLKAVLGDESKFADEAAQSICQEHILLAPKTIGLFRVNQEKEFLPSDHLAGKHPLDAEFATTEELKQFQC